MKRWLITICIAATAGTLFAEPSFSKSDRERDGLLGPVQSAMEESGIWTEGASIKRTRNSYSRSGNLLESEVSYSKIGGKNTIASLTAMYEYADSGVLISSKTVAEDGTLHTTIRYQYDEHGNLIERTLNGGDGRLIWKELNRYDAAHRKVEVRYYLSHDTLRSIAQYSYDERGNLSAVRSLKDCASADGCQRTEYRAANTYDSKGNLIKKVLYKEDGSVDEVRTSKYNANNVLTEEIVYDSGSVVRDMETYLYKFDEHGNWIERITTTTSERCRQQGICKDTRKITYFVK